jgi:type II secretory pathway pseudopilin PulG
LDLARIVRLDTEDNIRASLSSVRFRAKVHFGGMIKQALEEYIKAHGGEWPTELSQLKPYFPLPVDDFMLQRYQILAKGNLKDFLPDEALIAEKTPVDNDHDRLIRITPKAMFMQEVSAAAREHDALMKLARPRDH